MEKFGVGTHVVYDIYGICRITDIKPMAFISGEKKKDYYILSVLNSPTSTYYVPVDGAEGKLRHPMTKEEIHLLLDTPGETQVSWNDNRQSRKDFFLRILDKGITPELMGLIRCLYSRRLELSANGKSLSSTDEGIFSAAEKLVREEFSFSLGIPSDEVTEYIRNYFEK